MSFFNPKKLNRAMEAGISNDQEACSRALRLPLPVLFFGGKSMKKLSDKQQYQEQAIERVKTILKSRETTRLEMESLMPLFTLEKYMDLAFDLSEPQREDLFDIFWRLRGAHPERIRATIVKK